MSLGLLLGLAASCVGEENPNERTTSASSLGDDQGESYYAGPDDGSWDSHDHDPSTTTDTPPDQTSTSTDTGTSDTTGGTETDTDTDTDTDADTESNDTTGGDRDTTTGG